MSYRHSFTVHAPLARVRAFHARPESLTAITPPAFRMQLHEAPPTLDTGAHMQFTLWLGPLPVVDQAWARQRTLAAYSRAQSTPGTSRNPSTRNQRQPLGTTATRL